MYRAGALPVAIAKAVGVHKNAVCYHLRNAGIDPMADLEARQRATKARFIAVWNAAATADEAAATLGLSPRQAVLKAYRTRLRDGIRLKPMPQRPHPPRTSPLGDWVAALLQRGLSNHEVVRRSRASLNYVGLIRKQLGLLTKPHWTPEEDALFAHAQLALAGWPVGDVRGTLGWYVYGTNGENVIDATAATQAEAWRLACEQARAVGMLRGGR
jgi:hypothetical protein